MSGNLWGATEALIRHQEAEDEPPMVICCQGPPHCLLQDDEAVAAQEAGCVWCKRITILPDGQEFETQPGRA